MGIHRFVGIMGVFFAVVFLAFAGPVSAEVLYNNGPFVNGDGTGAGGADESIVQNTSLNMTTLGFGHQLEADRRIADDFTIDDAEGWDLTNISFYAYQTGSGTTSSMTAVNLRIWDGPPAAVGSSVVFGDTTTNLMTATEWTGVYRVAETTPGDDLRPIMRNTITLDVHLDPGTYWLDWQADGSDSFSGPWAQPVTINGQTTTGNALQSIDAGATYDPALDGGTAAPQDFPFIIEGSLANVGPVPTLSEWGMMLFIAMLAAASMVVLRKRHA